MFELFDPRADVQIGQGTNLPHWFQPGVAYFVTFRTEDSIPAEVSRDWHFRRATWLKQRGIDITGHGWKAKLAELDPLLQREFHETFSSAYMDAIDKGHGACVLRSPALSQIVADALLHFDGERYQMGDFVVMPNHVHLVVGLLGDTEIEAQCTSWKRFTARLINQALGTKGRFWQEESFDHLIRSYGQLEAIQRYIAANPAGLKEGEFCLRVAAKVAGTLHVPSTIVTPPSAEAGIHGA